MYNERDVVVPAKGWLTAPIELYRHSKACRHLASDLLTIQQVHLCSPVFLYTTRRIRKEVLVL